MTNNSVSEKVIKQGKEITSYILDGYLWTICCINKEFQDNYQGVDETPCLDDCFFIGISVWNQADIPKFLVFTYACHPPNCSEGWQAKSHHVDQNRIIYTSTYKHIAINNNVCYLIEFLSLSFDSDAKFQTKHIHTRMKLTRKSDQDLSSSNQVLDEFLDRIKTKQTET